MKTAVVVGLFVVVACLNLQANGAVAQGKSDNCKNPPEGLANTCHSLSCDDTTGEYRVLTCSDVGIGVVHCPEGTVQDYLALDLSKPLPECCPRPYCRPA